jgi:hypothetical protein
MTSLFSPPKMPPVQPAAADPPPQRTDAEVRAQSDAERRRLAARQGRSSTILTGTSDMGTAARGKTLLGE